jgi:hypothetical protein
VQHATAIREQRCCSSVADAHGQERRAVVAGDGAQKKKKRDTLCSECDRVVYERASVVTAVTMGVDWSKQCQTASSRPLAEKRNALDSSYYTLVAAYALVAVLSFGMIVRHLRSRAELWRNYAPFLVLTCAGSVLGELMSAWQAASELLLNAAVA